MGREKTLVLVFPPLTTPTSPPLGPAMLKGYVEGKLPDWRVEVLDLNLWTIEHMISGIAAGRVPLSPSAFPEGYTAAYGLARAAEVFRTPGHPEFYGEPAKYNWYGELLFRFTDWYSRRLEQDCEVWEQGGPQPDFRTHLDDSPCFLGPVPVFSHYIGAR